MSWSDIPGRIMQLQQWILEEVIIRSKIEDEVAVDLVGRWTFWVRLKANKESMKKLLIRWLPVVEQRLSQEIPGRLKSPMMKIWWDNLKVSIKLKKSWKCSMGELGGK